MLTKIWTIWCDGKDCLEWDSFALSRAVETKRAAFNKGWEINRNKHICPKCQKKRKNDKNEFLEHDPERN